MDREKDNRKKPDQETNGRGFDERIQDEAYVRAKDLWKKFLKGQCGADELERYSKEYGARKIEDDLWKKQPPITQMI